MKLERIITFINKFVGKTENNFFIIKIKVDTAKINLIGVRLLYLLLNSYEDLYFIIIVGLPYCLMSDAKDHIIYEENSKYFYHDNVCKICDFKKSCPGWQKIIKIDRSSVAPVKDMPNEIVMEITTKCNLNCNVCSLDKSQSFDVNFETAKKIMDESKRLKVKAVRFTGGEPFLNPDLEKMLTYAKKNKFYVLLNTNATIINDSILKLLDETVDNVLVSLQGYNKKTDAFLTKFGVNFETKIANIVKLRTKIPILRIGTAISKTLINNIDKYYKLLLKMGVNHWEIYRPIIKNNKEFKITKNELEELMLFLLDLKKKGMKVRIANPVPFCFNKDINLSLATLLGSNADDGHSRIIWDVKGYFKPSYFININLGKTIIGAWNNDLLRRIRKLSYLPLKCKKCVYLKWCKGGSRAIAKLIYQDYFHLDPLADTLKELPNIIETFNFGI